MRTNWKREQALGADEGTLDVWVPAGGVTLEGDLGLPSEASGIVLFAHGSGSSRKSPRNRQVAKALRDLGLATLLIDLLTPKEELVDLETNHLRFDIDLLARRLVEVSEWLSERHETQRLALGYFGASTGAAAALTAAASLGERVCAVVSRGGRPDLARGLDRVRAPTLLIVGANDEVVLELNRQALARLRTEAMMLVVPGATHLFEEPGALEEVSQASGGWFTRHLTPSNARLVSLEEIRP